MEKVTKDWVREQRKRNAQEAYRAAREYRRDWRDIMRGLYQIRRDQMGRD